MHIELLCDCVEGEVILVAYLLIDFSFSHCTFWILLLFDAQTQKLWMRQKFECFINVCNVRSEESQYLNSQVFNNSQNERSLCTGFYQCR